MNLMVYHKINHEIFSTKIKNIVVCFFLYQLKNNDVHSQAKCIMVYKIINKSAGQNPALH